MFIEEFDRLFLLYRKFRHLVVTDTPRCHTTEGVMNYQPIAEATKLPTFGRRKVRPCVCVVDSKRHIRTFLTEALEELGFITCECVQAGDVDATLDNHLPDLVVLGLSAGGVAAGETLKAFTAKAFEGKVLLLGPGNSRVVEAVRDMGHELGLAMLPPLATPFGTEGLRASVAAFLPVEAPPSPPVDAAEAMREGWLELWYQPKIDTRTLVMHEAEALIRIRHPTWGLVPPAYFIASDGDPHLAGLSEFVIGRAIEDWHYFFSQHGPIELAINLPISFLQGPEAVENLCRRMPDHPGFKGMIIEINGCDVVRNLEQVKDIAKQLRFHNIAVSIDDLGAEWPSLVGLDSFPFVELKVDRQFIAGCADDRLKRAVCRQILDLADSYGARTVAEGVEMRADFVAVRDLGFDMVQGYLFAKPAAAKKFARTMLGRPMTMA
jgi:EAL domain-containing protein (putative c-di-GMP-specific phosphodiesterase class I)